MILLKIKCASCNKELPKTEYHIDKSMPNGIKKHCKGCSNKKVRETRYKRKNKNADLITCLICNKQFRTINNTHLRLHSTTMAEYKLKFNQTCFTRKLINEQKERREATIRSRYTTEEIYNLKLRDPAEMSRTMKRWWADQTKEYKENFGMEAGKRIKLFISKLTQSEYGKFEKNKLNKRKETNKIKYGVEFPQSLDITKDKVKATKFKKYGDEYYHNIDKARQTHFDRYGIYSNFCPRFSLTSQQLFKIIEERIIYKCFYATNGEDKTNEFQIYHKKSSNIRFLDFYIPEINKWIEFDEKYHYKQAQLSKDEDRVKQIKDILCDVELLRIKEKDFTDNPSDILELCLNFINSKPLKIELDK